ATGRETVYRPTGSIGGCPRDILVRRQVKGGHLVAAISKPGLEDDTEMRSGVHVLFSHPAGSLERADEVRLLEAELEPAVVPDRPKRFPVQTHAPRRGEAIVDRFGGEEHFTARVQNLRQLVKEQQVIRTVMERFEE